MKRGRIILITVVILVSAFFALNHQLRQQFGRSVDRSRGIVTLPGLRGPVTIRTDPLGVPRIEAENEPDLFFATGWVTARDRLWQMTAMKMAMEGRLSEIAGGEFMKIDIFMRTLGVDGPLEEAMERLDPVSLEMLESFSRGVNAYVDSHGNLPAEFFLTGSRPEPWRPIDSLYVLAMLSLNLSFNFIEELDYLNMASRVGYEKASWLVPIYPDEDLPFDEGGKLAEIEPGELNTLAGNWGHLREGLRGVFSVGVPASNNWALAGSKARGGRSIVCNDTHLGLMMPNEWFMIHQKCPSYEAAGITAPGLPLVALGFNGKVAWGATMVMADNQDIFVEKLMEKEGRTHYLYRGAWVPVTEREELFRVRGREPVKFVVRSTVHGPILNDALANMPLPPEMPVQPLPVKTKYGLALSWGIRDSAATIRGFRALGDSRNTMEARTAILGMESAFLNIIYGDGDSIAWQVSGSLPVRKKGTGMLPSPGWTGDYDWTGYRSPALNPHRENPPEGFLATANNRTVEKEYRPVISSSWYNPERIERIRQVLGPIGDATAEDMTRLQYDRFSLMAAKTQYLLFRGEPGKKIAGAIAAFPKMRADDAREVLEFLKPDRFNAVMERDSASAAVFGAFIHSVTRRIFLDELGPEGSVSWEAFSDVSMMSYSAIQDHILGREDSPFWDDIGTPARETKWQIIAGALHDAIVLCEEKMGNRRRTWKWGRLLTYHWKHDFAKGLPFLRGYFNRGPFPAGGDSHTVNVATPSWGNDFSVHVIPAMRLVVDFGLPEPAMLVLPHGQSGNPSSPHYDDMLELWLEGETHPLPFGMNAAEKQYGDVLVLKPKADGN
ncbi:MAG: penicillin acylase family protein [Spirochaetes bacterium]|nr:penicillin acylase family protein [Spirochaetota bacterium]